MENPVLTPPEPARGERTHRRHHGKKTAIGALTIVLGLYLLVAYLVLPVGWKHYARRHPSLVDIPNVTHTGDGTVGDPLNVALVGTKREVMRLMVEARWYPADPLTLRSCLEIAEATVLKRPYDEAPVSSLFLFGRREDLAFECPVGDNPRERHHVRLWRTARLDPDGRPLWIGAAIFDRRVGFSRETGQITHVTAPDIDAERDFLFRDLVKTDLLLETYFEDDFHQVREGRNGGGDPWFTDGRLEGGVIRPGA